MRVGGVRRGGARHGGSRAGVRYGGVRVNGRHYGGGWYGRYPRYGYWGPRWGGYYWGYPSRWGFGWGLSFWAPAIYAAYSPYWIGGCPTYGFGSVYYGPTYESYFLEEEPVYGPPVVVEEAPVEDGMPLEEGPEGPEPVPAGPVEEAPEANPDAPGLQEFDAGVKAFQEADFEAAMRHFAKAAQLEPDNGELWMAVTHASFAEGEYASAASGLAHAAKLGGFPRGYRYDPRPAYPSPGTFDTALENLERYRKAHPDDADSHLVAAYLYLALGEREKANKAIVRVLELRADDQTAPLLNQALLPPVPPKAMPEEEQVQPAAEEK